MLKTKKRHNLNTNLLFKTFLTAAVFSTAAVISSCSSSGGSEKDKILFSQISLPPGAALINCEIVSAEESDNFFSAEIKVEKVNRYGASTPLINAKENLQVRIKKSLLVKDDKKFSLSAGKVYELLIQHFTAVGNISYWEALQIK